MSGVLQFLVLIEERRDVDRGNQADECREHDHQSRTPDPPVLAQAAHQCEQGHDQKRPQNDRDAQADDLIAHPLAEILIQEVILVLAEVAFIDGHRKSQDRSYDDELNPVERCLKGPEACDSLRKIAHFSRPAEM